MCKVFGMAGITDKTRSKAIQLMKEMAPLMSKSETHGLGYVGMTADGSLHGEKWTKNYMAFKSRPKFDPNNPKYKQQLPDEDVYLNYMYGPAVEYVEPKKKAVGPVHEVIGNNPKPLSVPMVAYILHTRYATTGAVSLRNTHPFIKDSTALIHNGIVYNHEQFPKYISDNDSEVMLNEYIDNGVNMDASKIGKSLEYIEAYFACLVLTQSMEEGTGAIYPALDIYKSEAFLDIVWVHDLETFVYCTDGELVKKACRALKLRTGRVFKLNDEYLIRINAITGTVTEKVAFDYLNTFHWSGTSSSTDDKEAPMIDEKKLEQYLKSKYGEKWLDFYDSTLMEWEEQMEQDYFFNKLAKESDEANADIPSYREDFPKKNSGAGMIIDATTTPYHKYRNITKA